MMKPDPMEVRVRMMVEEANDSLKQAAEAGYLSTVGAEARQFCTQALNIVAANGGRWDERSASKVRAARDALTREIQSARLGELAPRHAHTCASEAVRLVDWYLQLRIARGRREIKKAVAVGDSGRSKESWSKRAQTIAGLRGTTNRKKGIGF